jgi:hypothetical protein
VPSTNQEWIEIKSVDFVAYSKAMRRIDKDLYNAFRREVRLEINRVRDELKDAWSTQESDLQSKWETKGKPIKGGATNIRSYVSSTRARVTASRARNMTLLNASMVRHPLFGDRTRWFTTPEGEATHWWDNEIQDQAPKVVAAVEAVMVRFTNEVARRINAAKASGGAQ